MSADMSSAASGARRIVVGLSGATGAIYCMRLLQALRERDVQTHLVISRSGALTLEQERVCSRRELIELASHHHDINDVGATIASGSFSHDGMVIAPCSMRTLAAVAHGMGDNLITRAADVALKEKRRLVLLARETPLNLAHLRNMVHVTEMGGLIMPPVPAFYTHPATVEDIVMHTVSRVLDQFGIEGMDDSHRWPGVKASLVQRKA